jgi:hypothetical protein
MPLDGHMARAVAAAQLITLYLQKMDMLSDGDATVSVLLATTTAPPRLVYTFPHYLVHMTPP